MDRLHGRSARNEAAQWSLPRMERVLRVSRSTQTAEIVDPCSPPIGPSCRGDFSSRIEDSIPLRMEHLVLGRSGTSFASMTFGRNLIRRCHHDSRSSWRSADLFPLRLVLLVEVCTRVSCAVVFGNGSSLFCCSCAEGQSGGSGRAQARDRWEKADVDRRAHPCSHPSSNHRPSCRSAVRANRLLSGRADSVVRTNQQLPGKEQIRGAGQSAAPG